MSGDSTEYSTEEIRVTGIQGITSNTLLPGYVQVADRKKIEMINGTQLTDVLRSFAGINIRSYGGSGSLNTASMNGSGAENTLILVDGERLNSAQNNQFDLSMFSKSNIERVEVLNGGLSSLYGSEAVGGVVNIITKSPQSLRPTISLSAGIGSFNYRTLGLSGEAGLGKLSVLFGMSREESDNDYDYLFTQGNLTTEKERKNSEYQFSDIHVSAIYKLSEHTGLELISDYRSGKRNLPGIETGSEPSNAEQSDELWRNSLIMKADLSGKWSLTGRISQSYSLTKYSDKILTNSYYRNSAITMAAEGCADIGVAKLVTGLQYSADRLISNETDSDAGRSQPAVYTAAELSPASWIRIYPSARIDMYDDADINPVTGNLGVNIKPDQNEGVFLKLRAGNSFSAPTFNEMYWKNGGNPDLRPERSYQLSAGIGYELPEFMNSVLEIGYSHIQSNDKIIWLPSTSGFWTPENVRQTNSDELIASLTFSKKISKPAELSGSLSFVYNNSVKSGQDFAGDNTAGNNLPYIPKFAVKAGAGISLSMLECSIFYEYIGERFTSLSNNSTLSPANLLEAGIQYTLTLNTFSITGRIEAENILNEDYQMISGYPMPMRSFNFRINMEY